MKVRDLVEQLPLRKVLRIAYILGIPLGTWEKTIPDDKLVDIYDPITPEDKYSGEKEYKSYNTPWEIDRREYIITDDDDEMWERTLEHARKCNTVFRYYRRIERADNQKRLREAVVSKLLSDEGAALIYDRMDIDAVDMIQKGIDRIKTAPERETHEIPVEIDPWNNLLYSSIENYGIGKLGITVYLDSDDFMTHIHSVEIAEDFAPFFEALNTPEYRQQKELCVVLGGIASYGLEYNYAAPLSWVYSVYKTLQSKSETLPCLREEELIQKFKEYLKDSYCNADVFTYKGVEYFALSSDVEMYDESEEPELDTVSEDGYVIMDPILEQLVEWNKKVPELPFYVPSYEEISAYCYDGYPSWCKAIEKIRKTILLYQVEESIEDHTYINLFSSFYGESVDERDPKILSKRYQFDDALVSARIKLDELLFEYSINHSTEEIFRYFLKKVAYNLRKDLREEIHKCIDTARWEIGTCLFKGYSGLRLKEQYPDIFARCNDPCYQLFDYKADSYKEHVKAIRKEDGE